MSGEGGAHVDDARAVGPDEAGGALPKQPVLHLHHVLLRDALRDAHHQRHVGIGRLQDGRRRKGGWHVDHGGLRSGGCLRLEARGPVSLYKNYQPYKMQIEEDVPLPPSQS